MVDFGDLVADIVLDTFDRFPSKAKPRTYSDAKKEWVPLAGIVLSRDGQKEFAVASLGTGMRCLPASKVPQANGCCLHDWHAEVVSIRAFNLFLIEQCALLAAEPNQTSPWITRRSDKEITEDSFQPFALRDNVRIHMFCSEAPCGDASMELLINAQTDATPWQRDAQSGPLNGRGYFSELGVVRRKPARRDAPETLSKSCSDKLALKQCTSLLSSLSSLLIQPTNAYLSNLVLPTSRLSRTSIDRAFGREGRMREVDSGLNESSRWNGGYGFRPFNVVGTQRTFKFSRDPSSDGKSSTGSNIAAMWTPDHLEVLIGGTIQGNKQFSARGSSAISNAKLWQSTLDVIRLLEHPQLSSVVEHKQYGLLKNCDLVTQRKKVKEDVRSLALKNWVRNDGDQHFELRG